MKILLCASKTPDTTTKINFTADKRSIETAGVQYILNPYDDHGLAKAMDIKEKHNAQLSIIHMGDTSGEAILRRCLAIGADEAVRINKEPEDGYIVAQEIANAVEGEKYDLIITGREAIDFNGNKVCDMLGEILGIPSIGFVTSIEIDGNKATLKRFIDGGSEKLEVNLPIVISSTKELAEPRIPNMRGIMMSRSKPIRVIEPTVPGNPVELVEFEPPVKKTSCTFIDASEAGKLIDILHNEDKVI